MLMKNASPAARATLDQRVQYSKVFVKFVTPFAFGWLVGAIFLDAKLLSLAAAIATLGFLSGIALHAYDKHLAGRVVWLGAANIAVGLAAFVTPPEGHMSFILVAIAIGPFVMFSARTEFVWLVGLGIVPIFLWFLSWATGDALFGTFEVSSSIAHSVLAPATAVTLFGTVLFVIAYFVRATRLQATWLLEAQQQSEQASEAKSKLMRSVSHEMLTPLHAISGFAEFLHADAKAGREISADQIESYSRQIVQSSTALRRIVENIFDFANWSSEDASPEKMQVSVQSCLHPVTGRFASALLDKQLHLDQNVDAELLVVANPVWLGSIFKQILDNAIKFSGPGGTISIEASVIDGKMVDILFKDSGPGFPKDTATIAFEAFERLGQETGTTSGVGIGLPLARTFAEAMGGKIVIDDDTSVGARVHVILPLAQDQ